jgi:hypothetical protein
LEEANVESRSETSTSLAPYLLKFALAYVIVAIVVAGVCLTFKIEGNTATSLAVLLAACVYSVQSFVNDRGRGMSKGERVRFSTGATLLTILITVLLLTVVTLVLAGAGGVTVAFTEGFGFVRENPGIAAFAAVFTVMVTWLATYWFAGMFGQTLVKSQK